MSLIRVCKPEEFKRVFEIGDEFWKEVNLPGKPDVVVFLKTWNILYDLNVGVIFGLFENNIMIGIMGATVFPDINDGVLVANEAFWFMSKKYRGKIGGIKLFKKFEEWAKEKGAKRIIMVALENSKKEKLDKFYKKVDYNILETHYIKEI